MYILCLRLDDGKVQPIAYSGSKVSSKRLRKLLKKFCKDRDVVSFDQVDYVRLYGTKAEVKQSLPEFK